MRWVLVYEFRTLRETHPLCRRDQPPIHRRLEELNAGQQVSPPGTRGGELPGGQWIAYRLRTARASLVLQLHAQTGGAPAGVTELVVLLW
jgi:hypothetical protein